MYITNRKEVDYMNTTRKIIKRVEDDLKPHNKVTVEKILEFYKTERKCCAIQATGTGKTFLILRLLEIYNDEGKVAVIFAPNREIIKQTKKRMKKFGLNNATFYTYQKLARMTNEEIFAMEFDLIVCDELHRTGAKTWGQKFEVLVNSHPESKVFGVTATPLRCADGRDMADEYFDGNKACDISLAEALVREIIPVMPLYVSALYTFEEEYQNMSEKIEKANNSMEEKLELQKELLAAKQQLEKANGVPEIIKKYITNYNGKYLVFCKDKKHLYVMKNVVVRWFREAGYDGKIFEYPYYSNSGAVKKNLKNFEKNKEEGLKLLFIIDKLNEGLHLDEVHGCILLRTTISNIIYYQQIGRAIDAGSTEQRVILDLVSNFNSLESFNLKKELKQKIVERQSGKFTDCSEEFEIDKFEVEDLVQECVEVFDDIDSKIMRLRNEWLDEEILLLKEKFMTSNKDELITMFPRHPYYCIKDKAKEFGLKKGKPIYVWDTTSDDLIYKYFPTEGRNVYKRFSDKRVSASMCARRANVLGVVSETNATGKDFSEKEIETIKKYFPIEGDDVYKRLNGRKKINVIQKMIKLGIRKPKNNKWEQWEKDIIINHYEDEGLEIIDRLPNRTKEQIRTMACRLGVKFNKNTSTGVKYVYLSKDGFYVVTIKGEYIGCYKTIEEAKEIVDNKISI